MAMRGYGEDLPNMTCGLSLVLSLVVACPIQAEATKLRPHKLAVPIGPWAARRELALSFRSTLRVTFGCKGKGKCVVPSRPVSCIDPGGRCVAMVAPVDVFCEVGCTGRIHIGARKRSGAVSRDRDRRNYACGDGCCSGFQKGSCVKP